VINDVKDDNMLYLYRPEESPESATEFAVTEVMMMVD